MAKNMNMNRRLAALEAAAMRREARGVNAIREFLYCPETAEGRAAAVDRLGRIAAGDRGRGPSLAEMMRRRLIEELAEGGVTNDGP